MRSQESNKNSFEVEISGIPLKVKSIHNAATVDEMVSYVNHKIAEALPQANKSIQSAAILAALNIAEELILLKRDTNIELDRLSQKTQSIISQLESSSTGRLDN